MGSGSQLEMDSNLEAAQATAAVTAQAMARGKVTVAAWAPARERGSVRHPSDVDRPLRPHESVSARALHARAR